MGDGQEQVWSGSGSPASAVVKERWRGCTRRETVEEGKHLGRLSDSTSAVPVASLQQMEHDHGEGRPYSSLEARGNIWENDSMYTATEWLSSPLLRSIFLVVATQIAETQQKLARMPD